MQVPRRTCSSCPVPPQPAGESHILGLNGDSLGMDGCKIRVLEQRNKVGLSSLLERHDSGGLETKVRFEILSDFTNEPLKWQLADEEVCGLLVSPDFTESDRSRTVTMGLLDTASSSRCLSCRRLGSDLLARSLSSSGLAGSLLGAGH